jgi:hypothetical protein
LTSKQLTSVQPDVISVEEADDKIIIIMPLAPMDCKSESGKMNVLCTTNGWIKTEHVCPRTSEKIQVNIFVGTRA